MVSSENITTSMTNETEMELYSVVLSSTTLCLALFFGSGGNITILLSLGFHGLLSRLRYIFLSVLLLVCTLYDLIWCPLEIYRLIHHYYSPQDVGVNIKLTGQCMFICLFTGLFCSLLIISIHSMCVLVNNLIQNISKTVLLICSVIGSFIILTNTIGYSVVTAKFETTGFLSYLILNNHSYIYRVTCYSVCIACSVIFIILMIGMLIYHQNIKPKSKSCEDSEFSEPPTPERLNINIPSLLIKGADEDNTSDKEDNEKTLSNQDQTKHLGPQDVASLKDDNTSTLGDLPSPSRTKNNHLSVNMAAILGRRRHTIGQIGSTGLDVMEKAKQYNYVRKFSVDIQALQAQLENPKIHGGNFPFRSDTELQKANQNDRKEFVLNRPSTPNLDARNWDKTDNFSESREDISKSCDECRRTSIHSQKSNKSTKSSRSNRSSRSYRSSRSNKSEQPNSSHETVSPPIITLSETTAEETHILNFQEDKGPMYIKLCCLLIITFICCLLPMYITETVRYRLSSAAYINILTCTMALSVVQTIIYPHVLFCMDTFIHNAVHKFFGKFHSRVMLVCYERQPVPTDNIDITVTQV